MQLSQLLGTSLVYKGLNPFSYSSVVVIMSKMGTLLHSTSTYQGHLLVVPCVKHLPLTYLTPNHLDCVLMDI